MPHQRLHAFRRETFTTDARVPKYGLHSLRHTAASLFIEQGDMPQQVVVDRPALAPQLRVGLLQILRVPEDDGRDQQVVPGGAESP